MATTIELMQELAEICAIRDEAIEQYDRTQCDEDARVYESAEIRLQDWLDRDAPAKCAALMALREERKAQATARKEQARQWQAHAKRATASAQWLEGLALQLLRRAETLTGTPALKLPGGRIATARVRTSQRVEVTDLEALPASMVRVKREADKVQIKAALKAGQTVQGAQLVDVRGDHVSIKG
tara:strand:+ start:67 stop:618 length:552 start_codon:yes stop_codon:yes gene_type:complete